MGLDLQTNCPANAALAARPGTTFLGAERFRKIRRSPYEGFPLGVVRDSYLQVLSDWFRLPLPDRPNLSEPHTRDELAAQAVHECLDQLPRKSDVPREMRTWIVRGTQNLLTAFDEITHSPDRPFDCQKVLDDLVVIDSVEPEHGVSSVEWTIWGGIFTTDDGATRELHSLCLSKANEKRLDEHRLLTAARVLADGMLAHRPTSWGAPYVLNPVQIGPAQRVIVRLIGVNDGSTNLLLDTSAPLAREEFKTAALPKAALLTRGGKPLPTKKCQNCQANSVCVEPPKRPGLLGIEGISAWPRHLTPSALSTYQTCPHMSFLKDVLGLSAPTRSMSPAQRRGQLVHEWIAAAHSRGVEITTDDLKEELQDAISSQLGWAMGDYIDARPWLVSHLQTLSPTQTLRCLPEIDLVVNDTDADVLVTARPDLLYAKDEHVNWREVKTLSAPAVNEQDDFFTAYPQIPLALCMLADRVFTQDQVLALGTDLPGVVELELIWPGGHRVLEWNAQDEATVIRARARIAQLTDSWVFDQSWQAGSNPPCRWCAFVDICEISQTELDESQTLPDFDPTTGEILSATARSLGISATLTDVNVDEEVAF